MYKYVLILFCAAMLVACNKKEPSDCGRLICTQEFRMILFNFTDKDGRGVPVKNYSAINQRTGEVIKTTGGATIYLSPGTFIVIDDSFLKQLSAEGDEIKVTATYEATGQTKSAILKVSGGKCACHIQKISGPETIAFD